jgi:hypothetical protein
MLRKFAATSEQPHGVHLDGEHERLALVFDNATGLFDVDLAAARDELAKVGQADANRADGDHRHGVRV